VPRHNLPTFAATAPPQYPGQPSRLRVADIRGAGSREVGGGFEERPCGPSNHPNQGENNANSKNGAASTLSRFSILISCGSWRVDLLQEGSPASGAIQRDGAETSAVSSDLGADFGLLSFCDNPQVQTAGTLRAAMWNIGRLDVQSSYASKKHSPGPLRFQCRLVIRVVHHMIRSATPIKSNTQQRQTYIMKTSVSHNRSRYG